VSGTVVTHHGVVERADPALPRGPALRVDGELTLLGTAYVKDNI